MVCGYGVTHFFVFVCATDACLACVALVAVDTAGALHPQN